MQYEKDKMPPLHGKSQERLSAKTANRTPSSTRTYEMLFTTFFRGDVFAVDAKNVGSDMV